jgi:hypothetical protein
MLTLTFAFATALVSADVAPPRLPFIAPRATTVTDQTKCDNATVQSVDAAHNVLLGVTLAGVVTYHVPPETVIVDKDGKPGATLAALAPAQRVRIYYVTGNGARTQEIDLQ